MSSSMSDGGGLVEFDDEPVSREHANVVLAIDIEVPDFEGLSDLRVVAIRFGARDAAAGGDKDCDGEGETSGP